MTVQVLPDGADYESSIPYHRLVAELFLGAARLADCPARAVVGRISRSRVREMVAFLAAVTRPDGLMPQVGDADDGRLHIFEGYGTTIAAGWAASVRSGGADVRRAGVAGARRRCRDVGGGVVGARRAPRRSAAPSDWFSQPTVSARRHRRRCGRHARHYLLVTNGVVGTNGFGNHKHNDQLSFEYHRRGVPLIVDPGSYVYTSDARRAKPVSSTASHNTLSVDGVEQNELRPDWLFRLFETSKAESVVVRGSRGLRFEYVGRHHGYERLDRTGARTNGRFDSSKSTGDLVIVGPAERSRQAHGPLAFSSRAGRRRERSTIDGDVVLAAVGRRLDADTCPPSSNADTVGRLFAVVRRQGSVRRR